MTVGTEPGRMVDPDPDHVLVPTLGRPGEDEALAYALEAFPDADVTLLAVVTPLDAPLSEGGVLEREDERLEQARQTSVELLEEVSGRVPSATDRVRIETVEGRPGNVVPQYASEEGTDHVVMYSRGTGTNGFARRFLGRNVATTVVDRTEKPVTVLE